MRRLMLLSILLVVVLALMIGGVVSAAHTAPLPPLLTSLHLNDCGSPCWIAIVPGQTTIAEACQRVTVAFANSTEYEARIDPQTAASVLWVMLINRGDPMGASIRVAINAEFGNIVDKIKLDFTSDIAFMPAIALPDLRPDTIIRIADLHQILGAPSEMLLPNLRTNQANFAALPFGNRNRGAVAHILTIDQDAPLLSLVFFFRIDITRPLYLEKLQPWQGFVSTRRYAQMLLNTLR